MKTVIPLFFKSIILLFCIILSTSYLAFSQKDAGKKWSTMGNNLSDGEFLGSTNDAGFSIKTNSLPRITIAPDGTVQFLGKVFLDVLSGNGNILLTANNNGLIEAIPFPGDPGLVLQGDGSFGYISQIPVDSILAADYIKTGNSIYIGNVPSVEENSIFSEGGQLYVQSKTGNNLNTIINANNSGRVGIGTINPLSKLVIKGENNDGSTNVFELQDSDGNTITKILDNGILVSGNNASASESAICAIGENSAASNTGSIAIGDNTDCSASNAITIGVNASVYPQQIQGIAIGYNASVLNGMAPTSRYGIAIGSESEVTYLGTSGMAIGYSTRANNNNSTVIGSGANNSMKLTNNYARTVAIGSYSDTPTLWVTGGTGQAGSQGRLGIQTPNPGGLIGLKNSTIYIDVDDNNNLVFSDDVTGQKTLADLTLSGAGLPPGTSEGQMVYWNGSDWQTPDNISWNYSDYVLELKDNNGNVISKILDNGVLASGINSEAYDSSACALGKSATTSQCGGVAIGNSSRSHAREAVSIGSSATIDQYQDATVAIGYRVQVSSGLNGTTIPSRYAVALGSPEFDS